MSHHPHSKAGTPLPDFEVDRRLKVIRENGGNVSKSARDLGIARPTLEHFWRKYKDRAAPKMLADLGYDLDADAKTPKDAWEAHASVAERKIADALSRRWRSIFRPRGAFVIFHSTDEHLDDDATPLRLIEADIEAAQGMGAIMCHGGDMLNNWPVGGRLAKQWAEQSCTLPDALLRAQHFISMFQPEVYVHGNHEEMNPYLVNLIHGWMPRNVITDHWSVNFTVEAQGGRDIRVVLSHKFQKGSSYFHPHHGVIREVMEGEEADLYLEGHLHVSGVLYRTLPERGVSYTAVSSAGYKCVDKYAARISRGGKIPKLKGRAHWIVCDPYTESGHACIAFDCAEQAEVYFNSLQNLRAA